MAKKNRVVWFRVLLITIVGELLLLAANYVWKNYVNPTVPAWLNMVVGLIVFFFIGRRLGRLQPEFAMVQAVGCVVIFMVVDTVVFAATDGIGALTAMLPTWLIQQAVKLVGAIIGGKVGAKDPVKASAQAA